jgi:hypothetical protein
MGRTGERNRGLDRRRLAFRRAETGNARVGNRRGLWARKAGSGWLIGDIAAASISVAGEQVEGPQQPAIGDPAGGATIDVEARAAIAALLAAARSHGLIAT